MSCNDYISNLKEYPNLFTNDKLTAWDKCTYVPFVSNLKGLIDIVAGVVSSAGIFAAVAVGVGASAIGLYLTQNANILWITGMPIGAIFLAPESLKLIARGILQQVPVVGNAILASYDIEQLKGKE